MRYPRRSVSPNSQDMLENPAGSLEDRFLGHEAGEAIENPPRQRVPSPAGQGQSPPPPPSPDHQSARSRSRDGAARLESLFHAPSRSPSPFSARAPSVQLGRAERVHRPTAEHNEDGPLDVAEEEDRDYAFDQLLDEPRQQGYPVLDLGDDWELDIDGGVGLSPDNGLYDEDFGLPDGEAPPHDHDLPQFQLRVDEDFPPEPEDDPDDDEAQAALSAAFQEPDLIRNAYIDALVQKSLYGATHRALKHQLKAARRTIAAHPDITAEDIAKMAQSISTVERRLGVSADDIITTFTLCPCCKRRYSPDFIAETDSDQCLNEGCDGILFTTRRLASGSQRRVSKLTYPYASPIAWLRHVLSLPGMAELMQTWRTGQDDHARQITDTTGSIQRRIS